MFRKLFIFIVYTLFSSCDLVLSNRNETVTAEEINWNTIDQYPLFGHCDETASKTIQLQCFEETFGNHFNDILLAETFSVKHSINDTIRVEVLISQTGAVTLLNIHKQPITTQQIPHIDSLIATCIKTLPTIYPATKRTVPIKVKMVLPIIVKAL